MCVCVCVCVCVKMNICKYVYLYVNASLQHSSINYHENWHVLCILDIGECFFFAFYLFLLYANF